MREAIRMIDGLSPLNDRAHSPHMRLRSVLAVVLGSHTIGELRALWMLAESRGWPYSGPAFYVVVDALDVVVGKHAADLAAAWAGIILRRVRTPGASSIADIHAAMHRAALGFLAKS